MLHLVFAGVGGGKTTHVMERIKDFSAGENEKITLIVPEQYTFTCEKNILNFIGPHRKAGVDIMSFTALGEKLLGKPALHDRKRLSEASAAVLMSMALEECADELQLYRKHYDRRSTVTDFLSLSSEFKQNGVSPEAVLSTAEKMENCLLKTKLCEIAKVLDCFDKKVAESFFNPDDLLTELLGTAALDAYFTDRIVFIDSFRGFTVREYEIIEHILRNAKAVYVTLCTYDLSNSDDVTDLFAKTKNTASRLLEISKNAGLSTPKFLYLSGNSKYNNFPPHYDRYSCPELAFLESALYSDKDNKYDDECENITLCRAGDIYSECEYVAATAKKLIRENGYRCRDIAVIARNISDYEAPLRSALDKCGLGIFEDYRRPADVSPVINIISAALSVAADGFSTDSIMRYLKTGLSGMTTEETAEVENYCYLWQISGNKWCEEWTQNPSGFGEATQADLKELKRLNSLRAKIVDPLLAFKNTLKGGIDGTAAVNALWHFTEKVNIPANLRAFAKELHLSGEEAAVLELERMWELLINMLDELEVLTRGKKITAKKLSSSLELMLSVQTVGNLPQGLDEIVIGSADRMRISTPKVVFIIGANDGVFPYVSTGSSTLTVKERVRMEELGIHLSETGEWRVADEKLIAYNSVCCARDRLFVTCSERSAGGDALTPCEFYLRIKHLFTKCVENDAASLGALYYSEGKQPAFEQLAKSKPGEYREAAEDYFRTDKKYSGMLVSLQRAAGGRNFRILDKKTAAELFGKNMFMSATRIEQYYKCAFSYYCRYGLKLMPRQTAELDPIQKGNVIHHVMEKMLASHSKEELLGMSEEEVFNNVAALMDEYLAEILDGAQRDERFLYIFEKLKHALSNIMLRLIEEFAHSDFVPVDFELPVGNEGEIDAYKLSDESGSVYLSGKIDRVDMAELDGKKYFRIIDYKSSKRSFSLGDVMQGLNMQMFVYLFALWKNGGEKYGDGLAPAGVLYYNAGDAPVSAGRNETVEEIRKKKADAKTMTGVVLNDPRVITLMEHGGSGVYIPAKLDAATGKISGSYMSLKALERLKEIADRLILQMAGLLRSGEIDALPVCPTGKGASSSHYGHVCTYCDYKAVCGYEEDIPVKEFVCVNTAEAVKVLEADEEGGEAE